MIKSFKHPALEELFRKGRTGKIGPEYHKRLLVRLKALDAATHPGAMDQPGWVFHPLPPTPRFAVKVSGNYRLTFEFSEGDAYRVDFEDYH